MPTLKKNFTASLMTIMIMTSTAHESFSYTKKSNGILVSGQNIFTQDLEFFLRANRITTVNAYARWLKKYITYRGDWVKDVWESPLQTLKRRYGDCEDFAFLSAKILSLMNYSPKIFIMIKKNTAHAICIFKQNGRYAVFDNNNLIRTPFESEKALKNYLKKQFHYTAVRTIDHHRNAWAQRNIKGILVSGS